VSPYKISLKNVFSKTGLSVAFYSVFGKFASLRRQKTLDCQRVDDRGRKPLFSEAFKFWLKLGFLSFGGPVWWLLIREWQSLHSFTASHCICRALITLKIFCELCQCAVFFKLALSRAIPNTCARPFVFVIFTFALTGQD
jgi:hypothetical protein